MDIHHRPDIESAVDPARRSRLSKRLSARTRRTRERAAPSVTFRQRSPGDAHQVRVSAGDRYFVIKVASGFYENVKLGMELEQRVNAAVRCIDRISARCCWTAGI
jgi:hypothetical protein